MLFWEVKGVKEVIARKLAKKLKDNSFMPLYDLKSRLFGYETGEVPFQNLKLLSFNFLASLLAITSLTPLTSKNYSLNFPKNYSLTSYKSFFNF